MKEKVSLRHSCTPTLRGVYIFVYSLLSCEDFGGVSTCLVNIHVCAYIRVFPAQLAMQNVVDFFVSTYHELEDTTFSYLLLALCPYLEGL